MNRLVVTGLAGIALLTAVGLGAVMLLDRGAPTTPAAIPQAAPPPAASAPEPTPLPPIPPPAQPAAPRPAPPRPAEPEAEAPLPTDPAGRLKALEPLRRDAFAGLDGLSSAVAACRLSGATIMLTLETMEGRIRVVSAEVQPVGGGIPDPTGAAAVPLDEERVRCVRGALEGRVVDAKSARPGRRWEMPWGPGAQP